MTSRPSAIVVAIRTYGQPLGPETKSPQSLISDVVGGGVVPTHDELLHSMLISSNSTSPLENWNLTALSKVTAATVIVFTPTVSLLDFQRNYFH